MNRGLVPLLLLAWTACGAARLGPDPTPYAPDDCGDGGSCRGGYSESKLGPRLYEVRFSGRAVPSERSADYALLRAAEITLAAGLRWFVVSEDPGEPFEGSPLPAREGDEGEAGDLPVREYTVELLRKAPSHPYAIYFDAALVQREIRARYGLPPPAGDAL